MADLVLRHLGPGAGRSALDLASGTGVISHLLDGLGFQVTGLDWSEAMLARARAKAEASGARIRFVMGDVERTFEVPESYDVIVTRHLVWTLVDPKAAFAEWHSLLAPGGKVLIVDGDFVSENLVKRMIRTFERLTGRTSAASHTPDAMRETHERILGAGLLFQGSPSGRGRRPAASSRLWRHHSRPQPAAHPPRAGQAHAPAPRLGARDPAPLCDRGDKAIMTLRP